MSISKALAVPMEFWFDEKQSENVIPAPEIHWQSRAVKAEKQVKELQAALGKIAAVANMRIGS